MTPDPAPAVGPRVGAGASRTFPPLVPILLAAGVCLGLSPHRAPAAAGSVSPATAASRPVLWQVEAPQGQPALQALLASAQGLLNRTGAVAWIRAPGLHRHALDRHRDRFEIVAVPDVWTLIRSNRNRFQRFLTCSVTNASLNLATSLAGPRDALVMDVSLRKDALALGLVEVADLRESGVQGESTAFERFGAEAARGLLIHQPVSKPFHLRDLAVARHAWVDFEPASGLSARVAALGPDTEVLGWGSDEHEFVRDVSRGGGWVIPADWALNLSAHQWLREPVPTTARRAPGPDPRPGERIVCFVVSDGDNVQWLLNGFSDRPGFWSSPRRGTFAVTWEFAPRLAELAPAAAAWIRDTATPLDTLVGGPSGGGYHFPHHEPDRDRMARRSADALARAGLGITSVLDSGGTPGELDSLLADDRLDGVLYKDYSPYNRRRGAVVRVRGKPVASYRFLLWEQRRADGTLRPDWLPDAVARAIASTSDDPTRSADAFSLVQVHAWSFRDRGGPLEAIHDTVRQLPAGTRVVGADEFLTGLSRLAE